MNFKKCPSEDELIDCLLGKLPEADCSRIEEHLGQCPACELTAAAQDRVVDTVVVGLRRPLAEDPYSNEPEYQTALGRLHPLVTDYVLARKQTQGSSEGESEILEQVGVYQLTAKLGEGGMGAVYKAVHTKLGKQVAIKILPSRRMRDENAVARFEREMRAVGGLEHPNIVRANDAGEADGVHFLAMEYVEGIDLAKLVRRLGPLPIPDACELIRQAALGLQYAHEHGLVHRDIKPSNVMLTATGGVKILDLGLALLPQDLPENKEALTSTGYALGTLDYMAPEQASDSHTVDIRTDIYSLGASLYSLLVGHPPFTHTKNRPPVQRIIALLTEPVPPIQKQRKGLPPRLASLIHKMLAKEPDHRFSTPGEVAAALEPFAASARLVSLFSSKHLPSPSPGEQVDGLASTENFYSSSMASTTSHRTPLPPPIPPPIATAQPQSGSTRELATGTSLPAPPPPPPSRAPSNSSRRFRLPSWAWVATAVGAAALLLVLGVVLMIPTKHGTVQITLQNFDDTVELTLNGDRISIKGLDEPLELKVGQYELVASSPNFETVTKSFRVKHDETTVVEVTFISKVLAGGASEPTAPVATPQGDVATSSAIREAAWRSRSLTNLKRIALAFHMYHDTFRTFPAAVQTGPNGVPHSWRISLLPFLDKRNLFESYRLDEPWDSEHNKTLLPMMPEVYQFPGDKPDSTFASYFTIVGPGSLFQAGKSPGLRSIVDGPADTLLIVESKREVPWTRPDPISFDPEGEVPELGGWYTFDFAVALCDGSAKFLSNDIDHDTLKFLIMCADRNPIDLRGGGRLRKPQSKSRPTEPAGSSPARPPTTKSSGSIEKKGGSFASSEAYIINHSVTMFTKTDPKISIAKYGVPMSKEQRDLVAAVDGRYLGQDERYGYQIYCFPNRGPMQLSWTGYADGNGQVSVCVWDGNNWRPSMEAYRSLLKVFEPTTYTEAISRPPEEDRIFVFVNCTSGRVFTDAIFGR